MLFLGNIYILINDRVKKGFITLEVAVQLKKLMADMNIHMHMLCLC